MRILKMFFHNKNRITKKDKEIPIHTIIGVKDEDIIYSSPIPAYCEIGNLIFERNFDEAIRLGETLLIETPTSSGIHINLMVAYFKIRNTDVNYLDKSSFHAKQAIILGHNTGYAQQRLVINLESQKYIHQAIELCNIILSDKFFFSSHGRGSKSDFYKRKERLESKKVKSKDTLNDKLFTKTELNELFNNLSL